MKYSKACISITMNKTDKAHTYVSFILAFYKNWSYTAFQRYIVSDVVKACSQLLWLHV